MREKSSIKNIAFYAICIGLVVWAFWHGSTIRAELEQIREDVKVIRGIWDY